MIVVDMIVDMIVDVIVVDHIVLCFMWKRKEATNAAFRHDCAFVVCE